MFGEVRIIAILAAVAGLVLAYQWKIHEARQQGVAECRAAQDAADARQAQENGRVRARQADNVAAIDAAHEQQVQRLAALAASRGSDLARLRGSLSAAVGPAAASAAPAASGPSDDDRLAVVGRLLGEGFGLAEEGRGGAESLAEQVKALQDYATKGCAIR